jgi:predicted site-specific integrase-resolvase
MFRVLEWFGNMKAIGYVRVSTDKQADRGVSLDAQVEKIRAMATVHDVELLDVLVDAGESAKDLDRPAMARMQEFVRTRAVGMVIVAKLDRLTRSVRDLAILLEQFQRRGVSLVSVAESLDTGSASGRLVLNIAKSMNVPLIGNESGSGVRSGEPAVVIQLRQCDPSFAPLTLNVGLGGLALRIQRVKFLIEPLLRRFPRVDRAAQATGRWLRNFSFVITFPYEDAPSFPRPPGASARKMPIRSSGCP